MESILETHGTQVASLIAANSNNKEGMVGITSNIEIIALNVK